MTLSPWIIYLWGIADNVRDTVGPLAIVTGISGVILFAIGLIGSIVTEVRSDFPLLDEKGRVMVFKGGKWLASISASMAVLFILIPSSKTIAMMVVLPAIVNSEPIQKDLPEVYRMAVDALKDQLAPNSSHPKTDK